MRTIKTMFKLSVALLSATVFVGNFALPVKAAKLPENRDGTSWLLLPAPKATSLPGRNR